MLAAFAGSCLARRAKVLNYTDGPVLTTEHAETIVPRSLEHRKWVCAIGL